MLSLTDRSPKEIVKRVPLLVEGTVTDTGFFFKYFFENLTASVLCLLAAYCLLTFAASPYLRFAVSVSISLNPTIGEELQNLTTQLQRLRKQTNRIGG